MSNRPYVAATALFAALTLLTTAPAAAQGEILITQAKANAGGVTPADAAGFPVTLSLPGAYVLGSNLNPPAGKTALYVISHNVDIDMNGFRLNGSGKAAAFGVAATHGESRIHDGIITNFQFDGFYLNGVGTKMLEAEFSVPGTVTSRETTCQTTGFLELLFEAARYWATPSFPMVSTGFTIIREAKPPDLATTLLRTTTRAVIRIRCLTCWRCIRTVACRPPASGSAERQ